MRFMLILGLVSALTLTLMQTTAISIETAEPSDDGPEAEEYEVYSALAEEAFVTEANGSGPVSIRDRTGCPKSIVEMKSCRIDAVRPKTWEDFKAKNSQE